MRILAIAAALPLGLAACSREPEAPPAPTMTPAEEACSALALQSLGLTAGDVVVTPVSSTKTGATVYVAAVNGSEFQCVVEVDQTVSSFGPA